VPSRTPAPGAAGGRRAPRPLVAAALSAVLPGAGHLYAGWRRRGWIFIAITALLALPLALLVVFVVVGGLSVHLLVKLITPFTEHPSLLLVLLAANAMLLAFRLAVVVDAYLVCRPAGTVRRSTGMVVGAAAGVIAILAATIYPHVYVGQRNLLMYDAATYDFASDPGQVSVPTTTTTTEGGGPVSSTETTAPTTTTSIAIPDTFTDGTRVNVLVMGGDAGVGRDGIRTDSMIVVSIDPETGWTAMFGIPRNLIQVPIPATSPANGAWDCPGGCFPLIANEIYQSGLAHPDLFPGGPNAGGNATKTIFGYLLGIDIDYFALVDLEGFVSMIDAVGGVDINVQTRIYDENYPNPDGTLTTIAIDPGTYHMDGETALQYARSRHGDPESDFGRMNRQKCVLEALAAQADPLTLFRELPTFVPAIEQSVKTDIPVSDLPAFIELASKADLTDIVSIRFMPNAPEFEGTPTSYIKAFTSERYPIPDRDFIAQTVATALGLPPLEAIETLHLQPLQDVCGPIEP
jgi:LCP family protein required for cell wall assembly